MVKGGRTRGLIAGLEDLDLEVDEGVPRCPDCKSRMRWENQNWNCKNMDCAVIFCTISKGGAVVCHRDSVLASSGLVTTS